MMHCTTLKKWARGSIRSQCHGGDFDEDFATLLDSLEASMPLAHASNLSRPPLAKMIHDLSEGLIGEVVDIVTRTAVAAVESGEERITSSTVMALGYVPLSRRRNSALRHSMT